MKIHIPNSAFLGNIDPFLKGFDPSNPKKLIITANKKWISIHPVVLSMIAALGMGMKSTDIKCEKLEAKSKSYLERMGLFKFLKIKSDIKITEHEPAGRFIPIIQIRNSKEITEAILYLLNHPDKQKEFGEEIKKTVTNFFSLKKMLSETISIYNS